MTRRHSDSANKGTNLGAAACIRETDRAILVEVEELDGVGETWIPKSCVHDDSEVFEAEDEGDLVVKTSFAKKEGWV